MKCKNGVWSYENKAVDEDEKSSGFVTGYCKVSLPGMKVPAKFLKSLLRGGCLVYSFLGTSQGNSLRAKWILSLFQGVPVKGSSCANVADRLTGGGIRISYFLPSAVDRFHIQEPEAFEWSGCVVDSNSSCGCPLDRILRRVQLITVGEYSLDYGQVTRSMTGNFLPIYFSSFCFTLLRFTPYHFRW